MRLLFIGAPGVGKGTYASRLAEKLGLLHVSSGELLRAEIANKSSIGLQVAPLLAQGAFVPDELIGKMISQHIDARSREGPPATLSQPPTSSSSVGWKGYILDGYPRNLAQARFVHEAASVPIDHVINLRQPYEVILAKISSRRFCPDCGFGYNFAKIDAGGIKMDPLMPKVPGVCDKCGSTKELLTRPDDVLETVQRRLDHYRELTRPLEEFYDSMRMLTHFDVLGGAKDYVPKLEALLRGLPHK